ncbi:MAG TPA: hypothetical protein EYH22_02915 [Candidatus Nanopusillus sp.]|nr:hypothetical protein [Candidatus Nanopusillus sp.]
MRSQFVILLTVFILFSWYNVYKALNIEYFVYESNIEKYIAYSFWHEIYTTDNITLRILINDTYYAYCKEIGLKCIFNGTHVIVRSPTKLYVLRIKQ